MLSEPGEGGEAEDVADSPGHSSISSTLLVVQSIVPVASGRSSLALLSL
jgi:hypothetical protein